MQSSLEADVAQLLSDLLAGQDEFWCSWAAGGNCSAPSTPQGLAAMAADEERLLATLQDASAAASSCWPRRPPKACPRPASRP